MEYETRDRSYASRSSVKLFVPEKAQDRSGGGEWDRCRVELRLMFKLYIAMILVLGRLKMPRSHAESKQHTLRITISILMMQPSKRF